MSGERALSQARLDFKLKLRLTDRWTPLRDHPTQAMYYWSPTRFKICPPGRRSGKTELAKRKIPRELVRRRKYPTRLLVGAPTHDQARMIWWDDLKALIPPAWVANINETRLEIWTHWGAMVRVFGFNKAQRAEGTPWDWICIDELADCPAGCFHRNLRPILSTPGREGGADLIGVPDEVGANQAEYEELWETGLLWPNKDPEICSYHWPSWDILDPREIESARRSMDELAFLQEYGGRFVRSGGKALPRFDYAAHVRADYCEYQPWLPLDWSLDFGTQWVASVIGQHYKGRMWVLDEIALRDSSTEVAAQEFLGRCAKHGWSTRRINVFGDASGRTSNQTTGESDYELLHERLVRRERCQVEWQQMTCNPLVKDTLNAVRARICTMDQVVHLHMHPRCTHTVDNCKKAPWPDGSNRLRDYHWLAALRYWCYALYGGSEFGNLDTAPLGLPNLGGR